MITTAMIDLYKARTLISVRLRLNFNNFARRRAKTVKEMSMVKITQRGTISSFENIGI